MRMTWRHSVVHYANTFGSLFVGHRYFHRSTNSGWRRKDSFVSR